MKKWLTFAVLAVSCLMSNTTAMASTIRTVHYKTYTNTRYGFSVQYPSTWKEGFKPTNGDGESFYSPSGVASFNNGETNLPKGDVVLSVVGVVNAALGAGVGQNFSQMTEAIKKDVAADKKKSSVISETIKTIPNKWVVVTEVQKIGRNALQYHRQYFSLYLVKNLIFTYPASQAKRYAPILNHIVGSFNPGKIS
jgi:hypothetical protein